MKILHATTSAGEGSLGIEKEVALLAVAQQARGSDVMIAIDRQGVFTETCREYGIPVVVHDRLKYPLARLVAMTPEESAALEISVQGFIEHLKTFNPDIIHCHNGSTAIVPITAGNRVNVPCAFTGDGPMLSIQGRRIGMRFATLCLTMASFEELLNSEIADTDVYYVPNGTQVVPSATAQETVAGHSPRLLVAGNLETRKGVDVLILAMVELRRRLGEACPAVNIYGDGARGKYLAEMATVLELNDLVRFHGFKLGVLEQCPRTDVLVMPSRREASPLVVLEAMSRGMPIVATDVGDVARMLPDPRYGRVVPPDSLFLLADAIESLLADIAGGRFDPSLPVERHRSLYSIEKFAERTETAYKRILMSDPARRAG
jgi:glycosyltransferase involved in cell wall biosynthesis